METVEVTKLGTMKVNGDVVVTDPCYLSSGHSSDDLVALPQGTYEAYIEKVDTNGWGVRVAKFYVIKEGEKVYNETPIRNRFVDSGQMMIVDKAALSGWVADEFTGAENTPKIFGYSGACVITCAAERAGVFDNGLGAVSRTGYGDGNYPLSLLLNSAKEPIGVGIEFISEDDDEDDE